MAERTLYNKIWDKHQVKKLESGLTQVLIGLHILHEVTSPQAFAMVRENNATVAFPKRTFATLDHVIPTDNIKRPFADCQAELMAKTLEKNCQEFGITYFGPKTGKQGVIHIVMPEQGLIQPGMTIACGDSHTSTHGAFGSLAFGIGSTEVRNVLETQTLALSPLKVRHLVINGELRAGVTAKDVILKIISCLGVKGGLGYAYEYDGTTIENMSMDQRMTICNMSIEGGARIGYINPDKKTYEYLKGREYAPDMKIFEKAQKYWDFIKSDPDAVYDDQYFLDAATIAPMVTWGINPAQAIGISDRLPKLSDLHGDDKKAAEEAYSYMQLQPGDPIEGTPINVAFIGSCTNGRINDLREAANILKGRKVSDKLRLVIVVPGSQEIKKQAEAESLDKIFQAAGAEWREPGCSMCLAMNPDKLIGNEISASSSNRNFKGRQGSPDGRTLLMSAGMVAATTIEGKVTDVRKYL